MVPKLSQAILLGSVGSKQGFGPHTTMYHWPEKCAIGAALFTIGYKEDKPYNTIWNVWPWTQKKVHTCPACHQVHYAGNSGLESAMSMLWILNDIHKWTRPQIAAWVASIEPAEEQVVEQVECQQLSLSSKS